MNILIACEESQTICKFMRYNNHECYSCDIQPCSGGHPEWHIQGDCLQLLNGNCSFKTADGRKHTIDGEWDMIIAHPPCTYLTVSGNRWFDVDKYGDYARDRLKKREDAISFFMKFVNAKCDRIAIENPIGIMSSIYKKPNQIIQPWWFGDPYVKSTCLWLKGLPELKQQITVKPTIEYKEWISSDGKHKRQDMKSYKSCVSNASKRSKLRSKTFDGIAKAIANQWAPIEIW